MYISEEESRIQLTGLLHPPVWTCPEPRFLLLQFFALTILMSIFEIAAISFQLDRRLTPMEVECRFCLNLV